MVIEISWKVSLQLYWYIKLLFIDKGHFTAICKHNFSSSTKLPKWDYRSELRSGFPCVVSNVITSAARKIQVKQWLTTTRTMQQTPRYFDFLFLYTTTVRNIYQQFNKKFRNSQHNSLPHARPYMMKWPKIPLKFTMHLF